MNIDSRVVFYGKVINVNDPMNLGRIRVEPQDWVISAYENAYNVREVDWWTNKDPFVFLPLLPIFLYQVPKEEEWVHIVFYNPEFKDRNKFYIQGGFSSPNKIKQETYNSSVKNSALGDRNSTDPNLSQIGFQKNPENKDLYPDTNTIALLGRYNSDILLPEGGVYLRSNKIGDSPDLNPTFNKKHGFSMLQNYKTKIVNNGTNIFYENNEVTQKILYVIEYDVYGGLGTLDGLFSGFINVYKVSPYKSVLTSDITEGKRYEFSDETLIGPIYREDYTFENFDFIVSRFRDVIKALNDSGLIINNQPIQQPFPFVFQPGPNLLKNYNLGGNEDEVINSNRFIDNVYLNQNDFTKGFGLVSQKGQLGKLTNLQKIEIEEIIEEPSPITYGITATDVMFLLSHDSTIPELLKINFEDATYSGNVLSQDYIFNTIIPNTNSMVRGEKLLELLELIVKFLVNHVHPYHGMAPVSTSVDGTTTTEMLGKLFDAYNTVLNQKIRIN
jgi:hypothetical protein